MDDASLDSVEEDPPPAGEEIHLPGPSVLPLLLAVGITVALVGVTISPIFIVAGLGLAVPVARALDPGGPRRAAPPPARAPLSRGLLAARPASRRSGPTAGA